jgi:hypothetical protein
VVLGDLVQDVIEYLLNLSLILTLGGLVEALGCLFETLGCFLNRF